ncbi:hypothetical protein CKH23_03545 [Salmonella enterica]|nr:hypothetical protein [Salmonella enterica]EBX1543477.1 hypothetical protein [Salmonella enterica subsp. enterica serovar Wa]
MVLGSAQNPHVLRVRSGFSALSVSKLAAPITPGGIGSKPLSEKLYASGETPRLITPAASGGKRLFATTFAVG